MNTNDPRREESGYGAGNLVGSSESGLRSAVEGQRALDSAQQARSERPESRERRDEGLGRLADGDTPGGVRAGTPAMQDVQQGSSAPSAPRDARDDADRLDG